MMRNDYRRSLILLRSNASGYSGHVRLERRTLMGTMYFLVQSPGDCPLLRAALVGRGRDGVYYACALGELQQDARGQAVLGYSFDPRDICRRELEQYQLAAITCAGDESCQVVLFGNICGHAELNWEGVRGALCELYAAQDAAQAEAEAQGAAAGNGQEAQSGQEAEAQNGRGAQVSAAGAQADAGTQSGAGGAQVNAGAQSGTVGAQADIGAPSNASVAQTDVEAQGSQGAQMNVGAQQGTGGAQADIEAPSNASGARADVEAQGNQGAQMNAGAQLSEGGAQADIGALYEQGTGVAGGGRSDSNARADASAQSGFASARTGDAAQAIQQVDPAAERLTAPASEELARNQGNVTIHVTNPNQTEPANGATKVAQPSNFARGETTQSAACSDFATQGDASGNAAHASDTSQRSIAQNAALFSEAARGGLTQNATHFSEAARGALAQNAAHFNGETQALKGEQTQTMGDSPQQTAPEQSAQPNGMQIGASQYGIEQTAEAQSAAGQTGAAGIETNPGAGAQSSAGQVGAIRYGVGEIAGAQFAAGQIGAAGYDAESVAGTLPDAGQDGAIRYGVGEIAGVQFAAGQVGAAGYDGDSVAGTLPDAGQVGALQYGVDQVDGAQFATGQIGAAGDDVEQAAGAQSSGGQSGAARTGEVLACDLLEERGVSASSPWPGAAEALRSLFRTAPALVDAPDDQCVYVEAPMPEGCGFPFVAAGILALGGALVAIRYALPAAWTEEPPAGLEDCVWVGDQNTGWWLTELPVR